MIADLGGLKDYADYGVGYQSRSQDGTGSTSKFVALALRVCH